MDININITDTKEKMANWICNMIENEIEDVEEAIANENLYRNRYVLRDHRDYLMELENYVNVLHDMQFQIVKQLTNN